MFNRRFGVTPRRRPGRIAPFAGSRSVGCGSKVWSLENAWYSVGFLDRGTLQPRVDERIFDIWFMFSLAETFVGIPQPQPSGRRGFPTKGLRMAQSLGRLRGWEL